jgi:N-dimethylarginine dimethylaminohydrolase
MMRQDESKVYIEGWRGLMMSMYGEVQGTQSEGGDVQVT